MTVKMKHAILNVVCCILKGEKDRFVKKKEKDKEKECHSL